MAQKESDQDLINRALLGDQTAFTRIMSRYHDKIFYFILKMVVSKTDAADITLVTFDKAFRNLESYRSDFAFSTWIFKIAQNATIDFARKRKNKELSIDYSDNEELSVNENTLESNIDDPEQIMIRQQDDLMVAKYIQMLSPKYRKLIELRYMKEYAYEEIAAELNLPLGTVKTHLFRAKNQLSELLLKNIHKNDFK